MDQWSELMEHEWPPDLQYYPYSFYQEQYPAGQCWPPSQAPCALPMATPTQPYSTTNAQTCLPQNDVLVPKGDTPREIRNKAEKQRRDKLNQSIAELASLVPPVVAASRKIDKTGVLRLTAHYLRAHQYVFGDAISRPREFTKNTAETLLRLLDGFLLTTTYKGIVVVVSKNVQQYLGYSELDLLGQNVFNITHEDDRQLLREQLMPKSHLLGPNGELLVPEDPEERRKVEQSLANEKKTFMIRFKKLSQRSEPSRYVTCHVEGSLRKSDRASRGYSRVCQIVRRARARGDNPCSSGNDVVFIGLVRPTKETFITEKEIESFKMEYRTRHSVDGQIIQCEQRIALVTGYMTKEVNGVNAMNFMHRDDVRWVIIALREMYDEHRLFGESCYRLMMKNGQFIYMKTRGCLEVDLQTRAVTSFVCTNTVVGEEEGKHLNKLMKKKFAMMVNDKEPPPEEEYKDCDQLPVEDPKNLEKVILHLVTNLPCPQPEESRRDFSLDHSESPLLHLSIIPPQKERILSAIDKIYSIINYDKMDKKSEVLENGRRSPSPNSTSQSSGLSVPSAISRRSSPVSSPLRRRGLAHINPDFGFSQTMEEIAMVRRQMEGSIFGIATSVPVPDEPAEVDTNSSEDSEEQKLHFCHTISEEDNEMGPTSEKASSSSVRNCRGSKASRSNRLDTISIASITGIPGVTGIIGAAGIAGMVGIASVAGFEGVANMSRMNGLANIPGISGMPGLSDRPDMAVACTSAATSFVESMFVDNTSSADMTEAGTPEFVAAPGNKRPNPTSGEKAKPKVSRPGDNVCSTFAEFINESITEDNITNLTTNASLGTFSELIESQDIDVEDLLQDIEKGD